MTAEPEAAAGESRKKKAPGKGRGAAGALPPIPTRSVTVPVGDTGIDFNIAADGTGPLYFGLGIRKSGSTMLHKIVNFLAVRNRKAVVDIPGTFFRNGFTVANWSDLDLADLLAPGNIYTGFRSYPGKMAESAAYRDALKIFMFRDPRDALVSQYFSDAYSHEIPKQDAAGEGREIFLKKRAEAQRADIDEWVLEKAGGIRRTFLAYQPALSDPKCLVLRYEDFVFQKRRMIHKILTHFGWSVEAAQLNRLLAEVDVVPESEDKSRFVRKAVPGDHNAKLKAETIRRLNNKLAEVLSIYDYH